MSMKPDPAPIPKRTKPLICESVYAKTEPKRHECEVRMIMNMSSKEERRNHLIEIGKRRGKAAADRLKVDVLKGWEEMIIEKTVKSLKERV